MNKAHILQTLLNGITEVIHDNGESVMLTLAPQHLSATQDGNIPREHIETIVAFNVNSEQWENYTVSSIVSIEQLTGLDAKNNENKLQASSEYMSGVFDDDFAFEEMEHPTL
jgi:hypothetical protein